MQKNKIFIISFLFAFIIHFLIIAYFHIYVEVRHSPVIYSWLNILNKNDLKNYKINEILVDEITTTDVGKKYFTDTFEAKNNIFLIPTEESRLLFISEKNFSKGKHQNIEKKPIYLWERTRVFLLLQEETILFKAFVSPYGKISFLFPEKLISDPYEGILTQQYLRESAIFISEKFFWTKLKILVK
ncbi:MAG: hypothetical protein NC935_00930 [Candidatus Omnitrophica bacterium]|nr:hypothetical protein [Candidatus Omnitrophota bacterium]